MTIVAAGLPLPTGNALFRSDWNHYQACRWICPPKSEDSIEQKTTEQDSGQIGAEIGLARVGRHGGADEADSDTSLSSGQQWHNDQRGGSDHDSWQASGWGFRTAERS